MLKIKAMHVIYLVFNHRNKFIHLCFLEIVMILVHEYVLILASCDSV